MGGLDALKRLVNRLSADFPAAVFLVVYVAANSPSLLALHMGRDAQNCRLQVEDEGVGFATNAVSAHSESNGTGLFNTRERLALFDGDIDIQSRPQKGTRVLITTPTDAITLSHSSGRKQASL